MKYKVEELVSQCLTSLIAGTTEENCLHLKVWAFDHKNEELSKFLDTKIEAMVKSQPAALGKSECLKKLSIEQVRAILRWFQIHNLLLFWPLCN